MRTPRDVSWFQAMLIAVLQGVSELFPVSSLGHTVLIPKLLRWNIDQRSDGFLAFVVALHLGTAIALIAFYASDFVAIARAWFASVARGRLGDDPAEKTAWLLIAGTIPVGILGVFLESPVKQLFGSPVPVSIFLALNGAWMLVGERLRARQHAAPERTYRSLAQLRPADGVFVGFVQSLALLPGISRSGSAIVGGLLRDLHHEDAARYSFLLATPVIFAASVLEIPKLFAPDASAMLAPSFVGAVLAGVTAYGSVAFLTRWFRHNDLAPFAWYCVGAGIISLVLFTTGVIPT